MRQIARSITFLLRLANSQAQALRLWQQSRSCSENQFNSSFEFKEFGEKVFWHSVCALAKGINVQ